MGTFLTVIIAVPIIGYGIYALVKSIKQEIKGGCSGCAGCGVKDCSSRKED